MVRCARSTFAIANIGRFQLKKIMRDRSNSKAFSTGWQLLFSECYIFEWNVISFSDIYELVDSIGIFFVRGISVLVIISIYSRNILDLRSIFSLWKYNAFNLFKGFHVTIYGIIKTKPKNSYRSNSVKTRSYF